MTGVALVAVMTVGVVSGCSKPTVQPNAAPIAIVTVSEAAADIVKQLAGDALVTALFHDDAAVFVADAADIGAAASASLVVGTDAELTALGVADRPRPGADGAPPASEGKLAVALPDAGPYPWLEPSAIQNWLPTLKAALAALTPAKTTEYEARAARYTVQLATLADMMRETMQSLPDASHVIAVDAPAAVTGMLEPFGFTILPLDESVDTVAEAEAMAAADLNGAIAAATAPMVYLAAPGNHARVAELAKESGRPIGLLFTVRPTADDGPAPGYLGMMRFNVQSLSEGLSAPLELPSPTSP